MPPGWVQEASELRYQISAGARDKLIIDALLLQRLFFSPWFAVLAGAWPTKRLMMRRLQSNPTKHS